MNTAEITASLATLFSELAEGAPEDAAYMLNRGDPGLFRSLDRLSAADASASASGGGTIAAHVEHLRYGLSLLNRWAAGENPWADADWSAAWRTTSVTEAEWEGSRAGLRDEAGRWLATLRTPREVDAVELNGVISSIAHFAYHVGAIRQISRAARGPRAND